MDYPTCKFGNDIFPVCKGLDRVSVRIIQSRLTLRQKLKFAFLGNIPLQEARSIGNRLEIFLCRDGKGIYLSYPQSWWMEFRRWD